MSAASKTAGKSNHREFLDIYKLRRGYIEWLITRMSSWHAEDVCQEVWIDLSLVDFSNIENPVSWAIAHAKFKALHQLEKKIYCRKSNVPLSNMDQFSSVGVTDWSTVKASENPETLGARDETYLNQPSVEEQCEKEQLLGAVREALSSLTPREQYYIYAVFWLDLPLNKVDTSHSAHVVSRVLDNAAKKIIAYVQQNGWFELEGSVVTA